MWQVREAVAEEYAGRDHKIGKEQRIKDIRGEMSDLPQQAKAKGEAP